MPHLLIHRGPLGPRFSVISEPDYRFASARFSHFQGSLTPRRPRRSVGRKKISSARSHGTAHIGANILTVRTGLQIDDFVRGRAVSYMKKIRWVLNQVIWEFLAIITPPLHLIIQQFLCLLFVIDTTHRWETHRFQLSTSITIWFLIAVSSSSHFVNSLNNCCFIW